MRNIIGAAVAALAGLFLFSGTAHAFSVNGSGQIIDGSGHVVQLNAAAWFGFEQGGYAPQGLWKRNWQDMINQMKSNGINAVRIPLCSSSIRGATVSGVNYNDNPDLQGLNSLQLLDKLVGAFDANGIYVLLDFHSIYCNGPSALWYTSSYSEQNWISDLVSLANRYKNNPHVLGWDLYNEPHDPASWGTGNSATDWNTAAERASAQVLAAAPNWLSFVEGIQDNPNAYCQTPDNVIQHFWGENLEPFHCAPLNIPKNKLVLAPHVYGSSVYRQANLYASNFPNNMPGIYNTIFGWLHDQGYAVVPTEFGGEYHEGDSTEDAFEDNFISYAISKGMTSVFYWAWNGDGWPRGGFLETDWQTINQTKLGLMKRLWSAGAGLASQTPPSTPPSTSSVTVHVSVSPATVSPNQHATASWSSSNASSCISGGNGWPAGTSLGTSGSGLTYSFGAAGGSYTVSVTCNGTGGSVTGFAILAVSSQPAPQVSLSLYPGTVAPYQHSTATWKSTNATSCTSGGAGWPSGQNLGTSGSRLTYSFAVGGGSYGLWVTCTGAGGSTTARANVYISN